MIPFLNRNDEKWPHTQIKIVGRNHILTVGNWKYINPRADGAKRRAKVLIPAGYLHPGKRKH
jgi:hypothetical protein